MGKILQHKSIQKLSSKLSHRAPPPPPIRLAHSLWQCLLFMGMSPAPSEPDPPDHPRISTRPSLQSSHTNTVSTPPRPRNPKSPPRPTTAHRQKLPPAPPSPHRSPTPLRLSSPGVVPHVWQTPSWTWMCLGLGRNRLVRRRGAGATPPIHRVCLHHVVGRRHTMWSVTEMCLVLGTHAVYRGTGWT